MGLRIPRATSRSYYAHLDSQGVSTGTRVRAGDPLGTVGNTGNARTTVPHLHFGIYHRREGPIDPMPFVHEPPAAPAPPGTDTSALGAWRRIDGPSIPLSTSPVNRAAVVVELPRNTVVRVQGATASWYRVRLPDGRAGFVPAARTRAADVPLRSERRAVASPIRDRPTPAAATLGYVEPDRPVPGSRDASTTISSSGPPPARSAGWRASRTTRRSSCTGAARAPAMTGDPKARMVSDFTSTSMAQS